LQWTRETFSADNGQKDEGFQHLRNKFDLEKIEARLKGGIFIGPEIRELMRDDEFTSKLKTDEC